MGSRSLHGTSQPEPAAQRGSAKFWGSRKFSKFTNMNARRILLARALALALLAPSASVKLHAQQSQTQQAQVQQEQQVDSEKRGQRYLAIPKLSPEDREEFGEQVVLQPTPSVPIFTGYTDNQLLFTSNALLTPTNEESDMIFISTTGFGIEPPMPDGWQKLHLSLNGRFQVYRYDDHDELNFHIYTVQCKQVTQCISHFNAFSHFN